LTNVLASFPCEIVDDGSCNVLKKTHGDLVNNINNETIVVVVVGDGVYFIPKKSWRNTTFKQA
jgi:intracellular sulfur oxidation DsrE/DsrF family protein